MEKIFLTVNGRAHELEADPATPLLYVLRNDLGLKGAKLGCALEQCGACRVIVDGKPEFSCVSAVGSFQGRRVTTVEGIGTPQRLHPLQAAFVAERAAQCGYCTPGMVVTAKALLDANPDPSEQELRQALAQSLCRCGSHARVLRAIRRAAREMRP